jgi:hypothetical protein
LYQRQTKLSFFIQVLKFESAKFVNLAQTIGMKNLIIASVSLIFAFVSTSFSISLNRVKINSTRTGNGCGLVVSESYTQELLGKNVGFYVRFTNKSGKAIDAIQYEVIYKNGFNEVKGSKEYTWQAGNIVGVLKAGEDLPHGATNWISGANKIDIKIIRVHFTDDSVCTDNYSTKTL